MSVLVYVSPGDSTLWFRQDTGLDIRSSSVVSSPGLGFSFALQAPPVSSGLGTPLSSDLV
jgi:hypothetical protein